MEAERGKFWEMKFRQINLTTISRWSNSDDRDEIPTMKFRRWNPDDEIPTIEIPTKMDYMIRRSSQGYIRLSLTLASWSILADDLFTADLFLIKLTTINIRNHAHHKPLLFTESLQSFG